MACPPDACFSAPPVFCAEGAAEGSAEGFAVLVLDPPDPALYSPPPPPPDPPLPESLPPPQAASIEALAAPTPRAAPRRINLSREIALSTMPPSSLISGLRIPLLHTYERGLRFSPSLRRRRAYT